MPQAFFDKLTEADRVALSRLQDKETERTTHVIGDLMTIREQREVFHWKAPGYKDIVFDIRGIKDGILSGELEHIVVRMDLDSDWVEHIRTANDVEPERLAAVRDLERPGIGILFPNNFTALIDGSHCAVRRYERGDKTFRMVILTLEDARAYTCAPGEERKLFKEPDDDVTVIRSEVRKV